MVLSAFEKAFAAARKAGKKEFTWNGKKYNTKLKEEVKSDSAVKTSPRPKARPAPASTPAKKREVQGPPMPKKKTVVDRLNDLAWSMPGAKKNMGK